MNIIIFLKQGQEDADGEHGPHVWWYQEEVNPCRRKCHLVSFFLLPLWLYSWIPRLRVLGPMIHLAVSCVPSSLMIWMSDRIYLVSQERMRAHPVRPSLTSSVKMRLSNSDNAWTQTTTMKINAYLLKLSSISALLLHSRRSMPNLNGSSEHSLSLNPLSFVCLELDDQRVS